MRVRCTLPHRDTHGQGFRPRGIGPRRHLRDGVAPGALAGEVRQARHDLPPPRRHVGVKVAGIDGHPPRADPDDR